MTETTLKDSSAVATVDGTQFPWYRTLNRVQWYALIASNLGWLFDGFETYALILTVAPALRQLLGEGQLAQIPAYAGMILAINLVGWGLGGIIGGILAATSVASG
jgi:hypothetical protein